MKLKGKMQHQIKTKKKILLLNIRKVFFLQNIM